MWAAQIMLSSARFLVLLSIAATFYQTAHSQETSNEDSKAEPTIVKPVLEDPPMAGRYSEQPIADDSAVRANEIRYLQHQVSVLFSEVSRLRKSNPGDPTNSSKATTVMAAPIPIQSPEPPPPKPASPSEPSPPIAASPKVENIDAGSTMPNTPPKGAYQPRSWASVEVALTMAVLAFSTIVLVLITILVLKTNTRWAPMSVIRGFGLVMLVTGALVLITAGYAVEQISPAMGLLGAVAGYLLGSTENAKSEPPKNGAQDSVPSP